MAETTNEEIYHQIIRRQVYLERYKNGVIQKLQPVVNKAIRELKMRVSELPDNTTKAQIEAAIRELTKIQNDNKASLYDKMVNEFQKLASVEATFAHAALSDAIPASLEISLGVPSEKFLARMVTTNPFQGLKLNEWMDRVSDDALIRTRQQIYIGLAEGEDVPKLTKRVAAVGDKFTNDVNMVTRTAINDVTNQARDAVYSENSDVIDQVMWRSVLDGRTSEICQARDGMTWGVDEDHPSPPAHPNCRSVLVPVIKSLKELGLDNADVPEGTRASMDGQVPSSETYQTWLEKQDASFQDSVLGPTRGDAFRNGGLTLDKFVNDQGQRLTINELEAKYPDAF